MNYLNTHIRLYAPPGIAIGANILSNNIELGYRWGISTIKDLTMTRGANALYFIGLNTYDVIPFSGSDAQVLTG